MGADRSAIIRSYIEQAKFTWALLAITSVVCAFFYAFLSLSGFSLELSLLVPTAMMVFIYIGQSVVSVGKVTKASAKLALSVRYIVIPTTAVVGTGIGLAIAIRFVLKG